MHIVRMTALAIAASLLAAVPAYAQSADPDARCALKATVASAYQTYDPFAPNDTVVDVQVSVSNTSARSCAVQLFAAPADGALVLTSGGTALPYRIDAARNGSEYPNDFGPFTGRVGAQSTMTVPVRLIVRAQQVVPRGGYLTNLIIHGVAEDNEPVTVNGGYAAVTLQVPARVEVSIAGTAATSLAAASFAPATMDFGVAQTGQSGRLYVGVWSNGAVTVSASSANGGQLRHVQNPALTPISYRATLDGVSLGLGGVTTFSRTPPMSLAGASYDLVVTLGEVGAHYAGNYRDTITINVDQN